MDLALSLFTTGPAAPDAASSFTRQPTKSPSTTPNHFLSLLFFQASTSFPTASLITHDAAKLKNFQFLRKTFEGVHAMMVRERSQCQFVILCPVDQSLMGKNELLGAEWEWGGIDEDFVTSHIVRVPLRERPETRQTLPTLNGRSLIVTDTTVTTAKGFRLLKQARLVAEKVFYDNEGRGWIVHLIDRPLVGINQAMPTGAAQPSTPSTPSRPGSSQLDSRRTSFSPDRTPTASPSVTSQNQQLKRPGARERPTARRSPRPSTDEDVAAATTVARRTSQENSRGSTGVGGGVNGGTVRRSRMLSGHQYPSYQNWTNARGAFAHAHHSHRAPQPALALPTVLQRFPGLSSRLEQMIMAFNDDTMIKSDLDDIRSSVDRLLTQVIGMLNQVDPNVLLGFLQEHNMTVDGLDLLVEDYILNSTYDIVFFKITLQLKQQDWELAEAMSELQHLDLAQVGLADTPTHHRSLVSALNEFQSIGILRTPKEKLQCLVQYVRVTSALSGGGADELIPILLLTILRSGISNLASNLYYMKHFVLFGDTTSGEYGYSLSTLEAVSRYILSHAKQLAPLSQLNQEYWQSIMDGDLDKVIKMREDQTYLDITAKALLTTTATATSSTSSRRASNASLVTEQVNKASDSSPSEGKMQQAAPIATLHPPPSSAAIKAAPFNTRDAQGNTDAMMACRANRMPVLRYLLEQQHVSANDANFEGTSLLMLAVELEQCEMVQLILQHLVQRPSAEDKKDGWPLSTSSHDYGINHRNVFGQTAVHVCVERGNPDLLNILLEAKPDMTIANNDGDTPLIMACKLTEKDHSPARYKSIIERLVEAMTNQGYDQVNNSGDSAFHYLSDPDLISLLAAKGADPDVDNYAGWTPLLKWALHDDTDAVQSLIRTAQVDYLMTDSRGYTALHMACLRGNVNMVRMLLIDQGDDDDKKEYKDNGDNVHPKSIEYRMPVDIQSLMDGATPLQLACQSGAVPVVDFLLRMGANPQLRDWANESPSDMTNDAQILELLDNASLFWDDRQHHQPQQAQQQRQQKHRVQTLRETQENDKQEEDRRVIRVVRGAVMSKDGSVQYIVKSGSTCSNRSLNVGDHSGIVTMERSLDDFKFLRKCLLVEYPDICIPSLEGFYSPFLLSPSRPSKIVMSSTARRLDMFLNYLSDHPLLKDHELLWEFMLMRELQEEMISTRSQTKQESALDTIYDTFPHHVDNLENEEEYFKMLQQTMMQLDHAIKQAQRSARKLHRSIQDVPQQLEDYTYVLEHADLVEWSEKNHYLQALRAIAATQSKLHTSDFESIGSLFEDFSFVVEGTLRALQHPQEIIASIRNMRRVYEKMQRAQKRSEALWHGLSTIGEGAMSAIGGAGAAIGAAGQAATSFALTTVGGVVVRTAPSVSSATPSPPQSASLQPSATTTNAMAISPSTTPNAATADAGPSVPAHPPEAHHTQTPGRRSSAHSRALSSSASFRSLSTLPVKDLSPSIPRSATYSRATGRSLAETSNYTATATPSSSWAGGQQQQRILAPPAPVTASTASSSPLSFLSAPSLPFSLQLPSFSFGSSSPSTVGATTASSSAAQTAKITTRDKMDHHAEVSLSESDTASTLVGGSHHHQLSSSESAMEELELQMSRASSLLNSMHGSLADELAHLQHHHTTALERAMRDFGARQLKIERSRLRDMVEILTELKIQLGPDKSLSWSNEAERGESGEGDQPIGRAPNTSSPLGTVRVVAGSGRVHGSGPRNLYGWKGAGKHGELTYLSLDTVLSPSYSGGSAGAMGCLGEELSSGRQNLTSRHARRHGSEGGQSLLEDDEKAELKLLQRQMEIQQSIDESLIEHPASRQRRYRDKDPQEEVDDEQVLAEEQDDSLSEKNPFG